ncbi:hypothetical protein SAMN04488548_1342438 [Gordonia westfalica]|uniref:Uncharacterized protein n=1 Tax=Gordonia westfalica TaxID=158898 RepID=A0A1H2JSK6_9ACTN|nr:hypothetical protein SAMN04488548_1342438 [Gordonia westfalica]
MWNHASAFVKVSVIVLGAVNSTAKRYSRVAFQNGMTRFHDEKRLG